MSQVGGVQVRVSGSGVKWRGRYSSRHHTDKTRHRHQFICVYVCDNKEGRERGEMKEKKKSYPRWDFQPTNQPHSAF